eukprot:CAMPEP_0202848082 /NCGR_PEP_ID=MMETSP1389-20130828/77166_1 /ASSEMBLY_ACC=CAM_ASM_000865 /TAXON_ID=302021 /ORGANISM="Rhodomonas sp., Strain CCMP768" /LENGTH=35 /DNA_ID= /DNA_START= /DNA_END= /DNA_ORIENTATION=
MTLHVTTSREKQMLQRVAGEALQHLGMQPAVTWGV